MSNQTDYSRMSPVRNARRVAPEQIVRACDALRLATSNRQAMKIWADAFDVSISSIEKYRRPFGPADSDTGRRTPIDRICAAMRDCHLKAGVPFWDSIAPLTYLDGKFLLGQHLLGGPMFSDDPLEAIAAASAEYADVVRATSRSMSEDSPGGRRITPAEARDTLREITELRQTLTDVEATIKQAAKEAA